MTQEIASDKSRRAPDPRSEQHLPLRLALSAVDKAIADANPARFREAKFWLTSAVFESERVAAQDLPVIKEKFREIPEPLLEYLREEIRTLATTTNEATGTCVTLKTSVSLYNAVQGMRGETADAPAQELAEPRYAHLLRRGAAQGAYARSLRRAFDQAYVDALELSGFLESDISNDVQTAVGRMPIAKTDRYPKVSSEVAAAIESFNAAHKDHHNGLRAQLREQMTAKLNQLAQLAETGRDLRHHFICTAKAIKNDSTYLGIDLTRKLDDLANDFTFIDQEQLRDLFCPREPISCD